LRQGLLWLYLSQRIVPVGTRRNPVAECAEPLYFGAVIR
jgi:hypothetical protein